MWLNGAKVIQDLDDNPIVGEDKSQWSVGKAVCEALLGAQVNEKALSLDEKLNRYTLAQRIHKVLMPIKVSEDEATLIKKLCNDRYPSPLVIAAVVAAFTTERALAEAKNGLDKDSEHSKQLEPASLD